MIDEFYKLSMDRDDERASILNLAFYKLLKMTRKFYLLGPNINCIPDGFEKEYGAEFIKSDFSTVAVDRNELGHIAKGEEESVLYGLLPKLDGQTLIYCSAPSKASRLMSTFVKICEDKKIDIAGMTEEKDKELIEWISVNVNNNWILNKALKMGVGMHHGALPRHIGSSIVDSFNKGKIKYLFCTSTLIEGVNTSAKNVILFDKKKGPKLIDYFDFKNIVGRTGRMKEHFIGRVYQFHPEPAKREVQVDFPFYTQENANSELLIQLDPKDIKVKKTDIYKKIEHLPEDLQEIVKSNKGMPVEGQLAIINLIEQDIDKYHPLMYWSNKVTYPQLLTVLELAWNNLRKKGESLGGVYTVKQLALFALKYRATKSLSAFIKMLINDDYTKKQLPDEEERTQKTVEQALQVTRHWFEYKLPKYLQTMTVLQEYVFTKHNRNPGDYTFLASQIENRFLRGNLSILLEYGVPETAIRKLEKYISPKVEVENIIEVLKKLDIEKIDLLSYEKQKLISII